MTDTLTLAHFPHQSRDKLRYGDTDRQGHVNNAVFSTYLETGRVEIIYNADAPFADVDCSFVLARLLINYRSELNWPGEVIIGSRIIGVGRSSIQLEQAIFQGETCVAAAETTIVHFDKTTRRSRPLTTASLERIRAMMAQTPH